VTVTCAAWIRCAPNPWRVIVVSVALVLRFGPGDAARCRFAVSPLQETMSALLVLKDPRRHNWYLSWLRSVQPVVAQLDLGLLTAAAPTHGHGPDFLWPTPTTAVTTIEDDLGQVLATDPTVVEAELAERARRLDPRTVPFDLYRALTGDPTQALNILVAQQRLAWQTLVAPLWDRMWGLLDADVTTRARQLADGGLEELFANLHPRAVWDRDALHLTGFRRGTVDLRGRGLILIPTAFGWPNLGIGPTDDTSPAPPRPSSTRCAAQDDSGNHSHGHPRSHDSWAPDAPPCWPRPSSPAPPAVWPSESTSPQRRSRNTSPFSATPVSSSHSAAAAKCFTDRPRSARHSCTPAPDQHRPEPTPRIACQNRTFGCPELQGAPTTRWSANVYLASSPKSQGTPRLRRLLGWQAGRRAARRAASVPSEPIEFLIFKEHIAHGLGLVAHNGGQLQLIGDGKCAATLWTGLLLRQGQPLPAADE
jgi:hypothetical protein